MADEEFEIDVYGDSANDQADQNHGNQSHGDGNQQSYDDAHNRNGESGHYEDYHEEPKGAEEGGAHQTGSQTPPLPRQQGVKRKEGADDRPVDPGASTALLISELNWWNTDDDIRGWVRQAGCEHELVDITFSEHKINGKSKGQAYLKFTCEQAATLTKHQIENMSNEGNPPGQRRHSVVYSQPTFNPFRTLPKDAPNRGGKDLQSRGGPGQSYNDRGGNFGGNFSGGNSNFPGFRGGRGGFNGPRGGMNQGGFNRNFSGNNMNAFNANTMGFNNPMGGPGFGGGFSRGGMMGGGMRGGMRGGRGGGMNMMGGMPMAGGMPMGGMAGPMAGMGMMGGGMGGGMPGFQGMQPGFNPNFFAGGGGGGGSGGNQTSEWQNPHGAKRPRPLE
ncbi:hypothetical protein N0V88_003615 [Collariella sp. IMI 366227]|nr:hypothetical protein N0V88_003615 [Collariella sp. IMI 366227]